MLTKEEIRSKILLKLKTQKEEDRGKKSRLIARKLFKLKVFQKAKRIMCYISFGGEVDTKDMIREAIRLGKMIAVPVCRGKRAIRPCLLPRGARLVKGPHGTAEPITKKAINLEDIDLVIVPGVAFDISGSRLGRGRGCYDYFLKRLPGNIPAIGLAFNFQILSSLPSTVNRDIRVDRILSA